MGIIDLFIRSKSKTPDPTGPIQETTFVEPFETLHSEYFTPMTTEDVLDPIFTRIATDAALIGFRHYKGDAVVNDNIDFLVSQRPNPTESAFLFWFNLFYYLLKDTKCAIIPVLYEEVSGVSSEPSLIRLGKVLEQDNKKVKVRYYDDVRGSVIETGYAPEDIIVLRSIFGRVKDGLARRLCQKYSLLDKMDLSAFNRLNILLQSAQPIRRSTRKEVSQNRIAEIEEQLRMSAFGIAYVDSTAQVHQINRPVTSEVLQQINETLSTIQKQFGLSDEILQSKASKEMEEMYIKRVVLPQMVMVGQEISFYIFGKRSIFQGHRISPSIVVPQNAPPQQTKDTTQPNTEIEKGGMNG